MKSRKRAVAVAISVMLMAGIMSGCQSAVHEPKREWIAVPIESFESIAGKWSGSMVRVPKARHDDWVRLAIGKDGQYEFASYRTIGVFSGRGQFALVNGKLTAMTERGNATGELLVSNGTRMLRFLGMMKDGTEYRSELELSP